MMKEILQFLNKTCNVLAFPDVGQDVVRSLIIMGNENGDIPRWPIANMYTGGMFGDNANQIIEDALAKGLSNFNVSLAYELMRLSAFEERGNAGRSGITDYIKLGYVPDDVTSGGPALTLAYSYNDWALAQVAQRLGKLEDYEVLMARSKNYKQVWSPRRQFMCARKRNAESPDCPPIPLTDLPYYFIEGNVWHYTWAVEHDPEGLMDLFGSPEAFSDKLEACLSQGAEVERELFSKNVLPNPYYWAGNEHDLLHPWLFHVANRSDLTEYWTRWLMDYKYGTAPDGLPGNDDFGTLSAWFLFAAMGFYPVTGRPFYILGSPLFSHMTLHLPSVAGGRGMRAGEDTVSLDIVAHNWSPTAYYVSLVELNGEVLEQHRVMHHQLIRGGRLEFWLQEEPF